MQPNSCSRPAVVQGEVKHSIPAEWKWICYLRHRVPRTFSQWWPTISWSSRVHWVIRCLFSKWLCRGLVVLDSISVMFWNLPVGMDRLVDELFIYCMKAKYQELLNAGEILDKSHISLYCWPLICLTSWAVGLVLLDNVISALFTLAVHNLLKLGFALSRNHLKMFSRYWRIFTFSYFKFMNESTVTVDWCMQFVVI